MTHPDFAPLSPAEETLADACAGSGLATLGDGAFPAEATPDTTIRAAFLAHLLTTTPLPPGGLTLTGARIDGPLVLREVTLSAGLTLAQCHLAGPVHLFGARLRGLILTGCHLTGLNADHAIFGGPVYLRGGTSIRGEISLAGTRITGDLQICGADLQAEDRDALFAPSLTVEGSVYLGNYPYSETETELTSDGAIFLASAEIGHDLFITRCAVAPHRDPARDTLFRPSEEHGPGIALSLARARMGGILYLRDNQIASGIVNLAGAHVRRLRDEPAGPGASYPIRLDGFTYDDFSRHAETGVASRLDWLDRRPADTPFTAQPYEQLARVLTHMGHRSDARTVRMRKEAILRREDRAMRAEAQGRRGLTWHASWLGDAVMRLSVGYGYRPARALFLAVLLVGFGGLYYAAVWRAGDMTPNAAPILISADWIAATRDHPGNPAAFWSRPGQAGQDWETFNGFAYAADLAVPLISLGQEDAWAPSTSRSALGWHGWYLRWFIKAAGWIITALGAAAVTGLVRQD